MKKISALFSAAVMTATMGLVSVESTQKAAADYWCNGFVNGRTIKDNVRVRDGGNCKINNSRIEGNVIVGRDATVSLWNNTITGNVEGKYGHRYMEVLTNRIDGNVISDGSRETMVRNNRIDGNIELFDNSGLQRVTRNTVDGNLVCEGNRVRIHGMMNTVRGDREGQCRTQKQYTVVNKRSSWGSSTRVFDGFYKIYDSWGLERAYGGQTGTIQIKRSGSNTWQNVGTTNRTTTATGYFQARTPYVKGAEVRVQFRDWGTVHGATINFGRM